MSRARARLESAHPRYEPLWEWRRDEIMWVSVTSWTDAEHIEGRLMSEPRRIATLHSGESVRVAIDDVIDYAVRGGDGQTLAGGAAHAYGVAHEH